MKKQGQQKLMWTESMVMQFKRQILVIGIGAICGNTRVLKWNMSVNFDYNHPKITLLL